LATFLNNLCKEINSSVDYSLYPYDYKNQIFSICIGCIVYFIYNNIQYKLMVDDEEDEPESLKNFKIFDYIRLFFLIFGVFYTLFYYNIIFFSISGFLSWINGNHGLNLMVQLFMLSLYMIESISFKKIIFYYSNYFVILFFNMIFILIITLNALFSQYIEINEVNNIFNFLTLILSPILVLNFEILFNEVCMMNLNLPFVSISIFFCLIICSFFLFSIIFTFTYSYTVLIFKDKFWLVIFIFSGNLKW
jgi:hypothetical protein